MSDSILLDVGNGELEIIVFEVNGNKYCINVLKTKEIINLSTIRSTASNNKNVLGITSVRDQVMTVVDLSYILDKKVTDINSRKMALVCEFNKQHVMFAVDNIIGIRRIKWSEIVEPDTLLKSSLAVGNILTENGILLMLDFEKIVADISASENVYVKVKDKMEVRTERGNKKIYIAEDSHTIGELLRGVLVAAGYTQVKSFNNGKEVLEAIYKIKEELGHNFHQSIDLLITDIEMPILDGHTVTRKIKEDEILRELPVVIFSSLITADLQHKGEQVGADMQISKPQIDELVSALDKILFYKGLTNA